MLWSNRKNKKNRKPQRTHRVTRQRKSRNLRMESLERREVLSGIVTATVAGGNLTLQGDSLDNQVTIQTNGPNSYLVSGTNGTSIVDNAGSVKSAHTVTGVIGNVTVTLDPAAPAAPANDSFTILAQPGGAPSVVPANLTINNSGFGDTNVVGTVNIGGNLVIAATGGAPGSNNSINAAAITGNVNVANGQGSTTKFGTTTTAGTTIGGNLNITNGPGATTNIGDMNNRTNVLGNVVILNDATNSNTITNTAIGGGGGTTTTTGALFVAKKDDVGAGTQTLTIEKNSNVFGPTLVANFSVQTGAIPTPASGLIPAAGTTGGTTKTTITNSQLQGNPLPAGAILPANLPSSFTQVATASVAAGPGMTTPGLEVFFPLGGVVPGLWVQNATGLDTTVIQGAMTTIGTGVPQSIGANSLADAVKINNRNGGGMVTLGPTAADPATTKLSVQGGMTIENGTNADGIIDTTIINQTVVTGRVYVYNAGGAGATNTMVHNSDLGTTTTGGSLGNPLAVFNDAGPDMFSMASSNVPWGAYIHYSSNNSPIAPGGMAIGGNGSDTSSSNTMITGGQIGHRQNGPSVIGAGTTGPLSMSLSTAFPVPTVAAAVGAPPAAGTPLAFNHVYTNGAGLAIEGSQGSDVVNITEAPNNPTTPLMIGGFVDIITSPSFGATTPGTDLPDTINISGNATTATAIQALLIQTGNAGDNLLLQNIVITGLPQLPANPLTATPPLAALAISTLGGIDTLTIGPDVTITPLAAQSVIVLSGGTTTDGDTLVDPNGVLAPFLVPGLVVFP